MKLKNNLKKSALLALSATMLITSVPAQAGTYDSASWKVFMKNDSDVISEKKSDFIKENWERCDAIIFKEASLSKKKCKLGDKVTVKITIDDSKLKESREYKEYQINGNVENLDITFKSALSEQTKKLYLREENCGKRNEDGTITFSGKFTIKQGMKSGDWIIAQIGVNYYYEGTPYAVLKNREYMGDDRYTDLSWGNFKVTGTKVDLQAPSFSYYKIKKLKGNSRMTYWKISDKSTAQCVKTYVTLDYDEIMRKKNGVYSEKWNTQKHESVVHEAIDIWGNTRLIFLSTKSYFFGENSLEKSKIEVKKVTPSSKTVTTNQKDKISLNMKWTKFKPKYVMIEYRAPYGSATKCVMMKASNKSKTKWTGTLDLDNTTHKGTWRLYKIHIKGKNSKGKTITTEINNKYAVMSQLNEKDYLKADFKSADIKVK